MPSPVDIEALDSTPQESNAETEYRVKRIFPTLQGEGFWSGTPAIFIRLVGCNQWSGYEEDRERDAKRNGSSCPLWCDTDFTPEGSTFYTAEALVRKLKDDLPDIHHLVFTGGEPLLQLDGALMEHLHREGFYVHVETNGTIPIKDNGEFESGEVPDWVCCSPKQPEAQTPLSLIHELKLIVPDYRPGQYTSVSERVQVQDFGGETRRPLYVQPEDGPRLEEWKKVAVDVAHEREGWMVSTQSHKTLGID